MSERQKSTETTTYKLVMIGDSGVGKSCLLQKLLDVSAQNSFISTIGVDVRTHNFDENGRSFKLQVWDTGGQQRYRPVLASCYRNADGIILVFDVTSQKTFKNLGQWISEISEFTPNEGIYIPKLLIGNKSDLNVKREIKTEVAQEFAKQNKMSYIETSALNTTNVKEAFCTLVQNK